MTDPASLINDAIKATIGDVDRYLQSRERLARSIWRSHVWQLVSATAGALTAIVVASRNIERGGPWWLTALCLAIMMAWALWAQATLRMFGRARTAVDEVVRARASLQGTDFTPIANLFTTTAPSAPDTTPEPKP